MFHQYSTTFTFHPLKNITKHLFIMWHMVIPFSLTFKSTALYKYASALSVSKSSKFLILQFLVNCCKLHWIFEILSKSHISDIFFKFQLCTTNFYINYDFNLLKSLNSPIYTSIELTCGTLIIKVKNSIFPCSIVSRVIISASNKTLCGTLIINLGKN